MAKKKASTSKDLEPKKAGRPKGSPNKKTLQVSEILALKGMDLVGELTKILFPDEQEREERLNELYSIIEMGGKPPPEMWGIGDKDKANLILKLMEYVYPKRRSIDLKAEIDVHKIKEHRVTLQNISNNPKAFEAIETICEVIK